MKVILNSNIENLGRVGDLIDVKPGYARNYLLPRNLAVPPTKHNIEVMKFKKVKAEKQLELDKLDARDQKVKLEELTLTIEKKAGESDTLFGSVTANEIQELLELKGFSFEKKKFNLTEPIKKLGHHVCKVKLIEDIEAEIKIEVLREGGELEEETVIEEPVEDVEEEVIQEEFIAEEAVAEDVVEEVVEEVEEEDKDVPAEN
jgi:large subunit ribosomal protein L9